MSLNVGSLHDDLVHCILLWLPVMSLLRFKTVCKSWYALIQSSSFTHQHYLHHLQHEEENYTLVMNVPRSRKLRTPSRPIFSVLSPHDTTKFQPQLVFDEIDDDVYLLCKHNISICNGIICLQVVDTFPYQHEKSKTYLWNPTIKQHYLLPPSPFPPPLFLNEDGPYVSIGFGFDSETQDYKVIRIFDYPSIHLPCLPIHIEIYSLQSDSWRTLDTVCFSVDFVTTGRTPYRSGTYCWMGRKIPNDYRHETVILCFDFAREVFETMALPDLDCVKSHTAPLLTIIRDQIAIVNNIIIQNLARSEDNYYQENYIEIWVLKEYGFKESWTKLYKIGPLHNPRQVGLSVSLSATGDFFLFTTGKQLFLDYIGTGRRSTLPAQDNLQDYFGLLGGLEIATYRESLVCIRPGIGAA